MGFILRLNFIANPKLKLFVSTCGSLEVFDTIFFGLPSVCVPGSWSERMGSRLLQTLGVAIVIENPEELTQESMLKILKEKRYVGNRRRV